MNEHARKVLHMNGISGDFDGHLPKQLTVDMLTSVQVFIVMTESHYRQATPHHINAFSVVFPMIYIFQESGPDLFLKCPMTATMLY